MAEIESRILLQPDSFKEGTTDVVSNIIGTPEKNFEFSITLGDLTEVDADAIVCPANPGFEPAYMLGGVSAAIARKAGLDTFEEAERKAKQYVAGGGKVDMSRGYAALPLGFALSTTSGNLERIKSIIHVNNMRAEENLSPCDEEVVRLCSASVLAEADTKAGDISSVAFPAIGTGLWGMSLAESLRGTLFGIRDYLSINESSHIRRILFVVFARPSYENAIDMQKILKEEVFPQLA